jgi:membrane-associated phospholipid phosphatase
MTQSTGGHTDANNILNITAIGNYSRLKGIIFILPLSLLVLLALFLYIQDSFSVSGYIGIQKEWFFFLNGQLSQLPGIEYNLAQLGDALISLSILSVLIIYAPKFWEALISASLVSAIFSAIFKKLFSVPRPAAALDPDSFVIIGKTLSGNNSLPSGHSITIFTIITVIMFAFMPVKRKYKLIWIIGILLIGLVIASTRIGLGAHYPLDVITGSIIGYLCGLTGIFISRKFRIWSWIGEKKYYPVFILLFLVCSIIVTGKIINENLPIFYVALICLLLSLYKISKIYVQK